jgi:hypothetical protein
MSGTGAPKTNGMAITGFVCSLLCWPLGLIFSIIGMNQTGKDPSQGGRGLALAGLIISIVFAVITPDAMANELVCRVSVKMELVRRVPRELSMVASGTFIVVKAGPAVNVL